MGFCHPLKHIVSAPVTRKDHSPGEKLPIFKSSMMPVESHCPFPPRPWEFIAYSVFAKNLLCLWSPERELSKSIFGALFGGMFLPLVLHQRQRVLCVLFFEVRLLQISLDRCGLRGFCSREVSVNLSRGTAGYSPPHLPITAHLHHRCVQSILNEHLIICKMMH